MISPQPVLNQREGVNLQSSSNCGIVGLRRLWERSPLQRGILKLKSTCMTNKKDYRCVRLFKGLNNQRLFPFPARNLAPITGDQMRSSAVSENFKVSVQLTYTITDIFSCAMLHILRGYEEIFAEGFCIP
ncbi:hypothetical protein EVAR_9273_1 [Eumeta japonica]|uniref:Uncharacterized protein n=1 Tax=Eumeta variegata TaxID=151549 RepID=A0A4C1TNV2_EUMVA|nr:hypothetical protein EVAR_9273_1 [Eumeta japonica]